MKACVSRLLQLEERGALYQWCPLFLMWNSFSLAVNCAQTPSSAISLFPSRKFSSSGDLSNCKPQESHTAEALWKIEPYYFTVGLANALRVNIFLVWFPAAMLLPVGHLRASGLPLSKKWNSSNKPALIFSFSQKSIPHNHITEQFRMVVIKTTFPMLGFLVSDKRHEWNIQVRNSLDTRPILLLASCVAALRKGDAELNVCVPPIPLLRS